MTLHVGGQMLDTYTRLHFSIHAFLNANSKLANLSLCIPTPLVKNTFFGTIKKYEKNKITNCFYSCYRKKQDKNNCFYTRYFYAYTTFNCHIAMFVGNQESIQTLTRYIDMFFS